MAASHVLAPSTRGSPNAAHKPEGEDWSIRAAAGRALAFWVKRVKAEATPMSRLWEGAAPSPTSYCSTKKLQVTPGMPPEPWEE